MHIFRYSRPICRDHFPNMNKNQKTVTADGWSTSLTTGHGITGARFNAVKMDGNYKVIRRAATDGKIFPTSEAAWAHAIEHGFTREYFARPSAFIQLRLSPATRRFITAQPEKKRWFWLGKVIGMEATKRYWREMHTKGCMAERRKQWNAYMAGQTQVFRPPPFPGV